LAPTKPASLKVRALQWLAQREHSPVELRGKLMRLLQRGAAARRPGSVGGYASPSDAAVRTWVDAEADLATDDDTNTAESAAAEVDAVMTWLAAHGYLSQQRFVESRVNARQSRFGNLRITRELQQHGVALDADAQQALRVSEYDRAREVWQRKYGTAGVPQDAAARVRQMRFLSGRGFSPDVIRRVLRATPGDD
jgi:regulatory protein